VAANLYLYVVPFAIWLRRAREMDFSASAWDASTQTVERVLRVFSPDLVATLLRLLSLSPRSDDDDGVEKSGDSATSSWSSLHATLIARHRALLEPYAPPLSNDGRPLSLSSLQADMDKLLQEMYMQHEKRVRELGTLGRWASQVERWFGQGVMAREEKTLTRLLERARCIAQFPHDYDPFQALRRQGQDGITSGAGASSNSASSASRNAVGGVDNIRTADGYLTEHGKELLLRGYIKFEPSDVIHRVDPMRQRVRSHEIAILVTLFVHLSDWLNERLHTQELSQWLLQQRLLQVLWKNHRGGSCRADPTTQNQSYYNYHNTNSPHLPLIRINLRFLADYRNLWFFIVTSYIVCKIIIILLC